MHASITLAELATANPAAARVFHGHGLDFCCGGRRTLSEACAAKGLDSAAIAREIDAATPGPDDIRWDDRPIPDLVDHILTRYHAPLRPELDRLVALAHKVEDRHADKPNRPVGLAAHLEHIRLAVADHLEKEERILFPMILAGGGRGATMPVQVLMAEHDDHAASLRRTRKLTDDLRPPTEACTSWRALYLGLDQLERDLKDHIHLENNVLFPRVLRGA